MVLHSIFVHLTNLKFNLQLQLMLSLRIRSLRFSQRITSILPSLDESRNALKGLIS